MGISRVLRIVVCMDILFVTGSNQEQKLNKSRTAS